VKQTPVCREPVARPKRIRIMLSSDWIGMEWIGLDWIGYGETGRNKGRMVCHSFFPFFSFLIRSFIQYPRANRLWQANRARDRNAAVSKTCIRWHFVVEPTVVSFPNVFCKAGGLGWIWGPRSKERLPVLFFFGFCFFLAKRKVGKPSIRCFESLSFRSNTYYPS